MKMGAERRIDVLAGEVRDDDAMTTRGARGKATRARRTGDD